MVNKAVLIALVAIVAGLVYDLSNVYVHDGFERPYAFKVKVAVLKLSSYLAIIGHKLNLGSEAAIFRAITDFSGSLPYYIRSYDDSVQVEDTQIEGINVRIYTPSSKGKDELLPGIIYYHGGIYIIGHINGYDHLLYELSKQTNTVVISVDYRLAPEYPFPTPLDDCYKVTKAVFSSSKTFGINNDRIMLAGDSAGGNAVASVTQRLVLAKESAPKSQILIYPWTQMYNMMLPSQIEYGNKAFILNAQFSIGKYILWLVGITDGITEEMENAIMSNNFTLLIEDENLRKKYQSYLDINLISDKYKKSYYDGYNSPKMQSFVYPSKLDDSNILKRDKKLATALKKILNTDASPCLSDDDVLKKLPKAYFVVCEWDSIKDEGLLYAERLRKNGVPVEIGFYENAYHGAVPFIDDILGYSISRTILDDLIKYINKNK